MKLSGQRNQVMRAIERLSKAYIWENFWDIFRARVLLANLSKKGNDFTVSD